MVDRRLLRHYQPTTRSGFFKRIAEIQSVRLEASNRKMIDELAVKISSLTHIPVTVCQRKLKPRTEDEVRALISIYERTKNLSIENLKEPNVFMDVFFNYRLTKYQVPFVYALLKEGKKRVANRWSRQSGKTKTSCAVIFTFLATNPSRRFMVTGAGKRVSDVVMNKMRELLFEMNPLVRRTIIARSLQTMWTFRNGSTLVSAPNAEHGLRGDTLHGVLLEEHEFIKNAETVRTSVVEPMLATTNGLIIVNSTCWDSRSDFARMFCSPECKTNTDGSILHREGAFCKNWAQFHFTYEDAVEAGVIKSEFVETTIKPLEQSDYSRYVREYLANWADDINTYFTADLIASCIDNNLDYLEFEAPYWAGEFLVGFDVGQTTDYSAVSVLRKNPIKSVDGRPSWDLCHRKLWKAGTPNAVCVGYIKAIVQKMQVCLGVYVDATRDPYVAEDLQKEVAQTFGVHLSYIGENFPKSLGKEAMFGYLKSEMKQGRLNMVYDDEMITQFNVEKYEQGKDGHLKFSHNDGTHDDLLFSVSIPFYATKDQISKVGAVVARTATTP